MDYGWQMLREIEYVEPITHKDFWSGICVWIERPHLLNRRLIAAELVEARSILETINHQEIEINSKLLELFIHKNLTIESFHQLFQINHVQTELMKSNELLKECINILTREDNANILTVRNLLSKNTKLYQDMTEISLLDNAGCSITFYPMTSSIAMYPLSPTFPYKIHFSVQKISLEVFHSFSEEKHPDVSKSEKWLASEMLPKIYKWCKYHPDGLVLRSLNLLSVSNYKKNLHNLKEKYGKFYVKIWPTYNSTDPYKFVYEDISICAYLITLWEEERKKCNFLQKQRFLDVGCGNGLLVDILSSEGYEGIGIDLRKRKIWDAFKSRNKLVEMAVYPNCLFPEYDWIIGNHPDELTPWIPIIAARSNYKMKMFLMPCCYFTFTGKYPYCDAGLTRYQSYLKFVENICEKSGFIVLQDKLRIPSTKRICFVCSNRSYEENEQEEKKSSLKELISNELRKPSTSCNKLSLADKYQNSNKHFATEEVVLGFQQREKIQPVCNCTDLNKNVIMDIVLAVVKYLLSSEDVRPIERNGQVINWNAGGKSKLEDLIKILDPNLLKKLKKQNGGFQTLLRNHKNIFQINNNWVQIRVPVRRPAQESTDQEINSTSKKESSKYKTKNCFFHFHHPQGCPLSSSNCSYSHEKLD